MKLYLLIISVAGAIIFALNCLVTPTLLCLILVTSAILGLIILHGAGAGITYSLRRFISPKRKYYNVSNKERKFWERLGVRKFKDHLPDLGKLFVGFSKAKIADPKDIEYIKKYIHETCVGEVGHFVGALLGFLIMACMPINHFWLTIALPCAIVNMVLAILPMIVMRYNRYKLTGLLKIAEIQAKREQKQEIKTNDS